VKDETARLESMGLFTKVESSEWAAPTFINPKKNQTVRIITDFHGLNKCLKRNPYPIPKLSDIFKGMEKFLMQQQLISTWILFHTIVRFSKKAFCYQLT
jgi:hypothetical protein